MMTFVTPGLSGFSKNNKVVESKVHKQCNCFNSKAKKCSQVSKTWVMVEGTGLRLLNGEQKMEMKATKEVKTGDRASFCRCWKSAKHPYCDGSHNKYNKETGDHVGPIVVAAVQPTE
ncbi:CDGSH iron sulfur domain-containing protein 2 [Galdieria sulphuraria]|uniref:CDGSH iron sulfur domain-containing protein 2 n=1 Tax=Galdieria sulphuraria TaxID=130081 RepID=M2XWR2_GALSU|nr:CDGSH iron sulfur domain-containing protein 2 [Galdieria sulphuraria]EME27854.1 CDGSH iron sulfur domain-containing protein 2 [Galdieria sulphuraria]|eukprot:XP_005704374.1 CDGSH iron sulfur domain-containing protein 2 [Galdieria sulphuraria]